MRIEANITPDGAFIPGFLTCDEFSLLNYIFFLLDTGSAISALSVNDLGENLDYSRYEKKNEAAIGIGGSLECYLIHNAKLFLLPSGQTWIEVNKFDSMCLLPPSTDQLTGERIFLPSIIGRDILGVEFDLIYARNGIFLER
jgi:hypothetical protein